MRPINAADHASFYAERRKKEGDSAKKEGNGAEKEGNGAEKVGNGAEKEGNGANFYGAGAVHFGVHWFRTTNQPADTALGCPINTEAPGSRVDFLELACEL